MITGVRMYSSSFGRLLLCMCFTGELKGLPEARQVLGLSGAQPVEGAGNMCPLSIGTDVASEQSEINCLVLLNLNPSS